MAAAGNRTDRTVIPAIDIGTGTFGDLDGIRLKTRSVLAGALAVGDFENYVDNPEPRPEDPGWPSFVGYTVTGYAPGQWAARLPGDNGWRNAWNTRVMPVTEGDQIAFGARIGWDGTAPSGDDRVGFGIQWHHKDGSSSYQDFLFGPSDLPAGEYVLDRKDLSATVPAGVVGATLAIRTVTAPSTMAGRFAAIYMRRKSGSVLIEDGAVTANQITASDGLWAKLGEFVHIKTEHIDAEQIEAGHFKSVIALSSRFVAGDPVGAAAELTESGLEVAAINHDAGGARHDLPFLTAGSGSNALVVTDGTRQVSSLDSTGWFSGAGVNAEEDITVHGSALMGAWANRGTDGSGDRDSILWNMPWGLVGVIDTYSAAQEQGITSNIPDNVEQMLASGVAQLRGGRAYKISLVGARSSPKPIDAVSWFYEESRVLGRYGAIGTVPPAPSPSDGATHEMFRRRLYRMGDQATYGESLDQDTILYPSSDTALRLGSSLRGYRVTETNVTKYGQAGWHILVEDLGPAVTKTGTAYGSMVPPTQEYTYRFYPTSLRQMQGAYDSYFLWNNVRQDNRMMQGWHPSASAGPYHTHARFGTAKSVSGSTETGKTISEALTPTPVSVKAYLRVTNAWAYNGSARARVGWHTSDVSSPTTRLSTNSLSSGAQQKLNLGSAGASYIESNPTNLRITFGPGSGSSTTDLAGFYGVDGSSSQRLMLELIVEK